ncbi:MAG: dTMP kinase [Candidatus Diapherotrites archaeon]|nr:dTMP kinase [Candidatus Diapherotrites archaeon]
MNRKGLFIVFEGLDGSGKGTLLAKTSEYLFNSFKELDQIVLTREPTFSGIGRNIRDILKKSQSPKSDAKRLLSLYLEDRKEHLTNLILPALSKGAVVLCDRYKYSTLAYQQTQGIAFEQIVNLHKNMLVPDLVLLLDVDPETALQRIKTDRTQIDKFEQLEFLTELRENYLKLKTLLPNEHIAVIDANSSIETVLESIKKEINYLLQARK